MIVSVRLTRVSRCLDLAFLISRLCRLETRKDRQTEILPGCIECNAIVRKLRYFEDSSKTSLSLNIRFEHPMESIKLSVLVWTIDPGSILRGRSEFVWFRALEHKKSIDLTETDKQLQQFLSLRISFRSDHEGTSILRCRRNSVHMRKSQSIVMNCLYDHAIVASNYCLYTHLLRGGHDVAPWTNRRQLLVWRRRRVGEPHDPVRGFRTAVHHELELHSAAFGFSVARAIGLTNRRLLNYHLSTSLSTVTR